MKTKKNKTDKKEFRLEDSFVAPWGLVNEELPIHYLWKGEVKTINIVFPKDFKVENIFNVKEKKKKYVKESKESKEVEIGQEDLLTEGYLSLTISSQEPHDEPLAGNVVKTHFTGENWDHDIQDVVFITRPIITIKNIPKKIILKDSKFISKYESEENEKKEMEYPGEIVAEMEQIGFSLAQVETEAWGEGELLTQNESVYRDLAETLVRATSEEEEEASLTELPEEARENVPVEIDDEYISSVIDDLREWLSEDRPDERFKQEDIKRAHQMLSGDDDKFKISDLYKHFEYLLMNSILDVVDRHPADNVQMQSPQTKIEIENRLNSFNISFRLEDKIGNEYESETIEIIIDDQRSDGGIAEMELTTEWDQVQLDPTQLSKLRKEIESDT